MVQKNHEDEYAAVYKFLPEETPFSQATEIEFVGKHFVPLH